MWSARIAALTGAVLLAFDAGVARADSDGYYCVGPGYIAYQFAFTTPPGPPHRLYVVRFGGGTISAPSEFRLAEFQVHGMRCRADGVDLVAWDAIHSVGFDSAGFPARTSATPLPAGRRPDWPAGIAGNLGPFGNATFAPTRRVVGTDADGVSYVLEVVAQPDSVRECEPVVVARIIAQDVNGRERTARVISRAGLSPGCTRMSFAPIDVPIAAASVDPMDVLLDALVFGPHGPTNVRPYTGQLRREFEAYLHRFDAYRTTRPPVTGGEMRMVDAALVRYERRIAAIAQDTLFVAHTVAFVDSLGPCYEWEGSHECPEGEAKFADSYQAANPNGPLSAYLPLLAAHRWLCAAEASDFGRPLEAGSPWRRIAAERLAIARASSSLLVRTAAERLAQRNRCFTPEAR